MLYWPSSAGLIGVRLLQTLLAAAFNAGKDIQQAQNVGVQGPYLVGPGTDAITSVV